MAPLALSLGGNQVYLPNSVNPPRFVSTGSVVIDLPMRVDHLPTQGADVLANSTGTVVGGGFNVVSAAARQGACVTLASPLGTGPNSAQARLALAAEGITIAFDDMVGDIGLCIALVEKTGERTFITTLGVEAEHQPEDLATLKLRAGDFLYVSGYDLAYPSSSRVLGPWLQELPSGVILVIDAGPIVDEVDKDLLTQVLSRVDVLTMNRREAGLLQSRFDLADWSDLCQNMRPDSFLVRRTGEYGCEVLRSGTREISVITPYPIQRVVDTTGAGDAHTGVLVASLMAGMDIDAAAQRANVAAAITSTRLGPATCPTFEEIDAAMVEFHPNQG
ncbi:MAG: PfkB family carbohydrate kinase [Buchananella hordeovulneris]|nr:PfkB family carbohydrate kinase [Buchananella hordeovulneris]